MLAGRAGYGQPLQDFCCRKPRVSPKISLAGKPVPVLKDPFHVQRQLRFRTWFLPQKLPSLEQSANTEVGQEEANMAKRKVVFYPCLRAKLMRLLLVVVASGGIGGIGKMQQQKSLHFAPTGFQPPTVECRSVVSCDFKVP